MFNLGDVWNLTQESVGQVGTLENATTVALTITKPDGTAAITPVVNPPVRTGYYRYDYTPTVAGRYTARWLLTFADNTTDASSETLDVRPADPGGIVSLDAAKVHLNITKDTSDAELRGWIAAVTEVIENLVGPCIIRSYDTVITQCGGSWWLPKAPVFSITSVTRIGYGPAIDPASLYVVGETGEVIQITPYTVPIDGTFAITYTAGRSVIPANIVQAALIILKHLWETQRGSDMSRGRMSMGGEDDILLDPGMMYAVPRRAVELLAPHRRFSALA